MNTRHNYKLTTLWTGNKGTGTSSISAYDRSHTVINGEKPELLLTTDNPAYGDKTKLNPEDLLVTALSSCHMLSYLYLCAQEGFIIVDYIDNATGVIVESLGGGGHFTEVVLNPVCTVQDSNMLDRAKQLHENAHKFCYIANSVNFEVRHNPVCRLEDTTS